MPNIRLRNGHRIREAPLSEYQMSPLAPARDIRDSRRIKLSVFIVILHDQNQLGGDDLSAKVEAKWFSATHFCPQPS